MRLFAIGWHITVKQAALSSVRDMVLTQYQDMQGRAEQSKTDYGVALLARLGGRPGARLR